jgi:14-3-3 protein beta/theta/zeta
MKMYVEGETKRLSTEERNLLSVAYKNVVGSRRSAWRVVNSLTEKLDGEKEVHEEYLDTLLKEIKEICEEVVVSIIRSHPPPL